MAKHQIKVDSMMLAIQHTSETYIFSFVTMNERNTDFVHPGCGGTFYEKADNVRLHGKFEPRFYKPDGVFIEYYFKDQIFPQL